MQQVTMKTIMAGPGGTADVGQTITVDETTAGLLKDGRFAVDPKSPNAPAPASSGVSSIAITAATGEGLKQDGPTVADFVKAGYSAKNYPPSGYAPKSSPEEIAEAIEAEETGRIEKAKSKDSIKAALDLLDPADDEDWTASGKPAMGRIEALIGTNAITRAEVEAMFPDFKRPTPEGSNASGTGGTDGGTGGQGGNDDGQGGKPGGQDGNGTTATGGMVGGGGTGDNAGRDASGQGQTEPAATTPGSQTPPATPTPPEKPARGRSNRP